MASPATLKRYIKGEARKNRHRVYICTGRSRAEVYKEIWDIRLDGMIGVNGSYVEDNGRWSCMSSLLQTSADI